MDEELHQLCKEVYKRTGWVMTDFYIPISEGMIPVPTYTMYPEKIGYGKHNIPLYTSDYLLEKLPPSNSMGALTVGTTDGIQYYLATYMSRRDGSYTNIVGYGDTALKALLGLTIKLHELGELK